jgi:1-phosphofructokinase family hexose kinase
MIITLTPNPAVDKTIFVPSLELGRMIRFPESQLDPAGKGINVSRMANRLGWPTIAFGFVAGEMGTLIRGALDDEEVDHHLISVPGQTRLNVTIIEEDGNRETNLYGPGPRVEARHADRLEGLLGFWLKAGRVLVLAGSLPPGLPHDTYSRYVAMARENDVLTIVDADEEALRHALDSRPHMIKPNRDEAQRLVGRQLPDEQAVVAAARELAARGIELVVISMGAAGTICVHGDDACRVVPPRVEPRSTVGSGDSLVAGLAVALAAGQPIVEGLRVGTAAGAATAMTPGTALGTQDAVNELLGEVRVEPIA